MRLEEFERQALSHLPGFVFSFNIADLKRRNIHLGHREGDHDIADLERLLGAMAGPDCLVARVTGNRWLMVSRHDASERVHELLDRYKQSDRISTGWSISATRRSGESRMGRQLVTTEIGRAVRCLYADVGTAEDLARAIVRIEQDDHDLPVDRPVHLRDIAALFRTPWRCVSHYPAENPSCPYCAGHDFVWDDGDGSIYSGDGRCSGCGADISITQVDKSAA